VREESARPNSNPRRNKFPARAWLTAACLACLALRAPAFMQGVLSDDEAIYDTMAQEIRAGGVMYRHTVDHKPPGTVYTYAALESFASGINRIRVVHFFGALVALATCIGLYEVSRILLSEPWAGLPPILYAVTSASKVSYDALAVNGELLMNLPLVFAALLALKATILAGSRRTLCDFGVGILLSIAFLYKYQAAVLLFALPFLPGSARQAWTRAALWALGFLLPIGSCIAYFGHAGALGDLVRWAVLYNKHYIDSRVTFTFATVRLGRQLIGVVLPGILLYASAMVGLVNMARHRDKYMAVDYRSFVWLWSLTSLAAVAVGGRFFGHYFLQPELPLSIVATQPVVLLYDRARWAVFSLLLAPALTFTSAACFPAFGRRLDDDTLDYAGIGAAIAARTRPSDTIWIWGNAPRLYYSSNRRAGVRYSFCNYLTGLSPGTPSEYDPEVIPALPPRSEAWTLALRDLNVRRPRLILDTAAAHWKSYGKFPIARYPDLAGFLDRHYRKVADIRGAIVYDWAQAAAAGSK
jgi:hypothetical protein